MEGRGAAGARRLLLLLFLCVIIACCDIVPGCIRANTQEVLTTPPDLDACLAFWQHWRPLADYMAASDHTVSSTGPYLGALLQVHFAQPPEVLLSPQGLLAVITQGAVPPTLALQDPGAPLPAWLQVPSDAVLVADVEGDAQDVQRVALQRCVWWWQWLALLRWLIALQHQSISTYYIF